MLAAFKARMPLPTVDGSDVGLDLCYSKTSWAKLRKSVPSLTFHFRGADMQLPVNNYFIDLEKLVCLAFARSSDSLSIFGNIQQQSFHIMYDLEAHLISFAPAACDTL
ncbi:hypothetical protein GOP47_0019327 [Adiantum capillus-veneris]|uniref:Peptidase A1 domain-containing protein n=1 Tax=Adiantum capillus-veneris TaxID=13818 RepID=A0A9D4UEW7_ADICA|nr:hypothetical protein GOP47_0019327 [Adiantum capillus-veneris]